MDAFFDAEQAREHSRALCFPRRVGTRGERRAARYVQRQFRALGLNCRRERFTYSHFPMEIAGRLIILGCATAVLLAAGVVATRPALAAFGWGLAGVLVSVPWRLHRFLGYSLPPRGRSDNVVAVPAETAPRAPTRVVFMAHYDTKSQLWPTGIRVALVTSATVACVLLCLTTLLAAAGVGPSLHARGMRLVALGAAGILLALAANVSGNRSPGAVDNAASVGVLLELARSWRPRPTAPVDVVWVASGSEEVELDGARDFLRQHAGWWREQPTLLINLESVGAGARIYLAGERQALRLAQAVAHELDVPHALLRALGVGMDHEPFAAHGLPAVSILGDVVRYSLAFHSPRDNMSLIDTVALERAGRLAAQLAWRWAELHQATVPVVDGSTSRGKLKFAPAPTLGPSG